MRLLIGTALCVAGAVTSSSELPQPIRFSHTTFPLAVVRNSDGPLEFFPPTILPVAEDSLADPGLVEIIPTSRPFDELDDNAHAMLAADVAQEPKAFTKSELCHTAASVATANNLPVPFFANLIQQESGFRAHVVSSAGAQGIAQFMPRVAASNGLANPFDPIESLTASGKFVARLVSHFGNLGLAAAAYNAGSQRVHDWMAKRGKLPAETRHYVRKITGIPAEVWARKIVRGLEVRLPPHARCPDAWTLQAQADELTKPVLKLKPSVAAKRETTMSRTSLGRPTPQPSQFAMGLPVSRFAATTTRVAEKKKAQDRHASGEAQSQARRDTKGGEKLIMSPVKTATKVTPQSVRVAIAH